MADLAAGWSQSDLQAFSAARVHNTTLHRGCQPSLAGLLGGCIFQTCCIQKAASELLHGQFSLGKRLSRIRGKIGEKAERLSLASLHKPTFPAHRDTQAAQGRAGSPCADLPTLPGAQGPQAATPCPPQVDTSLSVWVQQSQH